MPFVQPFREKFKPGDLIYGLDAPRKLFYEQREKIVNNDLYFIDHYALRSELVILKSIARHYDERRDEIEKKKVLQEVEAVKNRLKKNGEKEIYNNFLAHLSGHEKYRSTLDSNNYRLGSLPKFWGQKVKGGLSWVTSDSLGIYEILGRSITIHFILDGISMFDVIKKTSHYKTNITPKELRWIYRHRNDVYVRERIQFWLKGKPVSPPWEGDNASAWSAYNPKNTYEPPFPEFSLSEVFRRLRMRAPVSVRQEFSQEDMSMNIPINRRRWSI